MRFEIKVALRYLRSRHKSRFISIVTFISVLGVAIGVMTLIVVLAVMTGFDNDLRQKIVGVNPHIYIQRPGGIANPEDIINRIKDIGHIKGASPFIEGQAMLTKGNQAIGVLLRGIDKRLEPQVSNIKDYLVQGSLPKDNDIVIGSQLAQVLNLSLKDRITAISPVNREEFEFEVCGIFNSGMYEYDLNLVYISISDAKEFFETDNRIGAIGIRCDNLFLAQKTKEAIIRRLGFGYWVRTWMEVNRNLFSSLKLEKTAMFIILVLIILVACFNIISTLIMTVMEKTKDIGILKSLGATRSSIASVFTYCGLIIGIVGTSIGVSSGFLLCYLLKTYKFIRLPEDIYYIGALPVQIQWSDSLIIALSAVIISYLATLYPAYQAARLNPVEALRYE